MEKESFEIVSSQNSASIYSLRVPALLIKVRSGAYIFAGTQVISQTIFVFVSPSVVHQFVSTMVSIVRSALL
jgi:hypothetical protein